MRNLLSRSFVAVLLSVNGCLFAQSLPLPGRYLDFVAAPQRLAGRGALADLDGDGKADLVHPVTNGANPPSFSLQVWRAAGGTFAPPAVSVPLALAPTTTAMADVDNDSDLDVAVACYGPNNGTAPQVWIYRNDGTGGFPTPALVLSSTRLWSQIMFVRADADANLDLYLADGSGAAVFRLGLGAFAFGPEIPAPYALVSQKWFDDDGDGDDDLHEIRTSGSLQTARNNGAAGFAAPVHRCTVDLALNWVTFADLDGDGNVDALMNGASQNPSRTVVQVAFGNAAGTLTPAAPQTLAAEYITFLPLLHDLDGNGRPDLLLFDWNSEALLLSARNDGTGHFTDVQLLRHPAGSRPFPMTGDIDGDGRSDALVGTVLHPSLGTQLAGSRDVPLPLAVPPTGTGGTATLRIGDFDLDGLPDAVCGLGSAGVLLARNFGTVPVFTQVPLGDVRDLALGDWNRDGNTDVLVARAGPPAVVLLLGDGRGGLTPQAPVALATQPTMIRAADLDGDGRLDVVALGTDLAILLGNGAGGFAAPMLTTLCPGACFSVHSLAVADFDDDGVLDVGVGVMQSLFTPPQFDIYRGTGGGALQPFTSTSWPSGPVLVLDFDGDGRQDLVNSSPGTSLIVQRGLGNGTFAAATQQSLLGPLGTGQFAGPIAAGDLDGDGRPDIACAGGAVLRNLGTSFAPAQYLAIQQGHAVAITDANGDLQRDIVVLLPTGHLTIVDNLTATTGRSFDYGLGCPGSGGFVPQLTGRGRAQPGGSLTFTVERALGASVGWLLLGPLPSTQYWGLGCRLFVDLNGAVTLALPMAGLPVPGGGTASLTLPIPPALLPMQVAAEAVMLDLAMPLGISGTGGVRVEIR